MKIGFIGYGKSTNRYHMPFVEDSGQYEIVGFYTRGSKSFDMPYQTNTDLTRFPDVEQLLNSDAEVISVTTPPEYHYEYTKKSILAGKHVIVEKPFCNTLAEVEDLYRLAEAHNVKITPYQNRRYDSDFLTIKNILQRQDIGKVMEIESNHTHYRPDGADNRGNQYDGSVLGHAVHFIDQIVSLYGEPDSLIYDVCNQKNFYIGEGLMHSDTVPEDYYDIKLIYGNLRIRVRHSQLIVKHPPRWIINATESTVEKYEIDQQERDLKQGIFFDSPTFGHDTAEGLCKIYYKDRVEEVPAEYLHYTQFYNDFKDWVEGKRPNPPVEKSEALAVIHILETIANKAEYVPLKLQK